MKNEISLTAKYTWLAITPWFFCCLVCTYFGLSPDKKIRRLDDKRDHATIDHNSGSSANRARNFRKEKNKHPNWISLRGTEFELWLQEVYQSRGYRVKHVGRPGDDGADLILQKDRWTIVIQAKGVGNKVNNRAVDQAHAAKSILDANEAWVVTNNFFTDPARKHAKGCHVRLYDRNSLDRYLKTGRQYQGHRR